MRASSTRRAYWPGELLFNPCKNYRRTILSWVGFVVQARIEFLPHHQHPRLKAPQCNASLQSIYRFQSRHGFNLSRLRIPHFNLLTSSEKTHCMGRGCGSLVEEEIDIGILPAPLHDAPGPIRPIQSDASLKDPGKNGLQHR